MGDTAWGIANAFSIRVAVTPQFCATFLLHPNAGEVPATEEARLAKELLTLARRTLHEGLSGSVASAQAATLGDFIAKCDTLGEAIRKEHSTYLAHRKRCGWFLHPSAWQARCNRNTHRATLDELWLRALTQFNSVSL